MDLGAFSISLTVKDLQASKAFYEKLGFTAFMGAENQNWLILRNGAHVIGLFQGLFEKNMLTFNPGWDQFTRPLPEFTSARQLRDVLLEKGLAVQDLARGAEGASTSFLLYDPDGNPVLIDQHI